MIKAITHEVMSNGRGNEPLWFHPRVCVLPDNGGKIVFLTAQKISGSDYFHPVHWMTSADLGRTWSDPLPIPGFGRTGLPDGTEEGVCDVVPEYHDQSGTVLAMGHNVFYRYDRLFLPQPKRWPVYAVWNRGAGAWSEKRRLVWDNPDASTIFTCGCAQRYTFPDGNILIPFSHGRDGREDRQVCTVLTRFDGKEVVISQAGPSLQLPVKRGLLEPSVTRYNQRFFMTIRAEDDRGYVVSSGDGMSWSELKPWSWEDGEPLVMSTTQQRWLTHSDGLYLVYTRKAENNINVMRWRAPLFISRVNTDKLCLLRNTERVVVPLIGDGIGKPDHVARLGNFHTVNVTAEESWVTVGECIPKEDWRGDTIIGRIYWSKPNRLAPGRSSVR
jgi:hypothetical protein